MSVRPEFAGRSGNCPSCGRPFVTPPSSTADPMATAPPTNLHGVSRGASPPPQALTTQPLAAPPPPAPLPTSTGRVAAVAAARASLEVVHGPGGFQGKTLSLDLSKPIVLGRDPSADLRIPSERVSRRHCQLQASPQGTVLVDLGSSNGTLINQVRVNGSQLLQAGDYIQTGDCLFRYSPS